jgi:ATP-dependent helicase HrpB
VARDIRDAARAAGVTLVDRVDDETFRRAVLAGYPDRVAQRRTAHGDRLHLASGAGARLSRDSGVHDAEYLVAVDVAAVTNARAPFPQHTGDEALVRIATRIERDWLTPTSRERRHDVTADGRVRAVWIDRYDTLSIGESHAPVDPLVAHELEARAIANRAPTAAEVSTRIRRAFAAGAPSATVSAEDLARIDQRALDRLAPETLALPSGRAARLDYRDDGRVVAAVKLQELFGLGDTPKLGPKGLPVTLELLAPNGRPVQVTSDLRSFWTRGYPEVRKALRARYPRHPWPEDPWTATPTHRVKKR